MTLTEQEKIQRAEEIYYRRNGMNYRIDKTQSRNNRKSHPIRNFILIAAVIGGILAYNNKEIITSPEFQNQIKTFLNTKIDIKDIFSLKQIKSENENNKQETKNQQTSEPIEQLAENNNIEPIETEQINENNKEIQQETQMYEVIWPHKGEITSNFGARESQDSRVTSNHTGIDIAGNLGDKIVSATNGKVVQVSEEGMLGKHIKIENENIVTVYAHCNNIYVTEGEEIKQGQEIGEVGSTGNSTGNHLHFEVIRLGQYIDPLTVIEKIDEDETRILAENGKEGDA